LNFLEKSSQKVLVLFRKKFAKSVGVINCVVNCSEKPKKFAKSVGVVNWAVNWAVMVPKISKSL